MCIRDRRREEGGEQRRGMTDLPVAALECHAVVRLHAARDWRAERVRGCGEGHKQRAHCEGCVRGGWRTVERESKGRRGWAVESREDRADCFQLGKDAGYKIVAHMMPDLPNVGYERDMRQFREYFENPAFRTDGLKLYPTLVIRGTGLYELWKTGRYQNYSPELLIDLVAHILALVPPWTRIYRIQRDIPMPLVSSGVEHGNLRELALDRMKELGLRCRDVRTREVGIQEIHKNVKPEQVELIRRDYMANGGWETFLSYEDPIQDILIGLLRLRKCTKEGTFRPELTQGPSSSLSASCRQCSIVRELHVYGTAVPVHARDPAKFQHQGYGTLLMEEAERIAREEHGSSKIAVISGVGTRHYYRKLGYELDGPYMSKNLL
eukprot:763054-Hanusia_phi.AAC.7